MKKSSFSHIFMRKTLIFFIIGLELSLSVILSILLLHKREYIKVPFLIQEAVEVQVKKHAKQPIKLVQEISAQSAFSYDHAKFEAEGFPQPSGSLPSLDPEGFQIYQQNVMPHIVKAANAVGTDVGFLAAWSFMEGINYNMAFNSCRVYVSLNTRCSHGNWQVSHGIRPMENLSSLQEAFDVMYGNHDPETIQSVGQSVIDTIQERHSESITNPASTFPRLTIEELTNVTNNDADSTNKMWVGHIMRDDAIYSYLQAVTMKYHWDRTDKNLATLMEQDWGSPDHYNRQRVIDFVKATYDAGISGSGVSSGGGAGSGSQTFTLVLRPLEPDSWVINRVTANAVGGGNGGSGSGLNVPPGSFDGQCTPTGEYPSDIPGELQSKYNTQIVGYSDEYQRYIYDVFTCLSDTNFPDLVSYGTVVSNVSGGSYYMNGCDSVCEITMEANLPEGNFKHILIHEFGHMIDSSNRREVTLRDEFEDAYEAEDGLSPYSGPFYGGQGGCPVKGNVEDFAENVAYFYQPSSGFGTGGCDNRSSFPNPLYDTDRFPLHFDVAKKTLIP